MLRSNSATPLYLQLFESLVEDITSGKFVSGGVLPSERELADIYGISRNTVHLAYARLAESGYAVRVHGKGTIVL